MWKAAIRELESECNWLLCLIIQFISPGFPAGGPFQTLPSRARVEMIFQHCYIRVLASPFSVSPNSFACFIHPYCQNLPTPSHKCYTYHNYVVCNLCVHSWHPQLTTESQSLFSFGKQNIINKPRLVDHPILVAFIRSILRTSRRCDEYYVTPASWWWRHFS
jgi:hypothetical protein